MIPTAGSLHEAAYIASTKAQCLDAMARFVDEVDLIRSTKDPYTRRVARMRARGYLREARVLAARYRRLTQN